MKRRPLLQPDLPSVRPPWDEPTSGQRANPPFKEDHLDVAQLARTLAAHGGGAGSLDLALDLILNEVVEDARRATGASGAAIALARAGEMVCRASSGADAPQLGDRLESTLSLSGACLQTGTVQQCNDTQVDPRVNAEACRHLGVRSIVVVPLADERGPFGILEVFSPQPNAFGSRDIETLQFLARRVVENKRVTEKGATILTDRQDTAAPRAGAQDLLAELERIGEPESAAEEGSPQKADLWTSILSVLVIALAVLLGLLVGWRGAVRGLRLGATAHVAAPAKGNAVQSSGATVAPPSANSSNSQPVAATPAKGVESTGGLVVTENGKVVFRLQSSGSSAPGQGAQASARGQTAGGSPNAPAQVSQADSTGRLIHRVEPDYPPEARAQHIQGAVVLDIQIAGEGTVRSIAPVSGDPTLAGAAIAAVKQWRYQPYSVDGRPVDTETRVTIKFTLPPS